MNLIDRAKNIILTPKTEWEVINTETTSTQDLYKGYIAPLAAIGPIASFIGLSLIGISVPIVGNIRIPIVSGIAAAIVQYLLGLVSVYVVALIINELAPTFKGEKNLAQALKLTAYSFTAAWLAGIFGVIPGLGILGIVGLYSFYLLFLGIPVLMKAPQDQAVPYTAVSVVCAIVVYFVIAFAASSIGGLGATRLASHAAIESPEAAVALGQLKQMGDRMNEANKKMEQAQKSGDAQAQAAAATEALGAALGGDANVVVVDQAQLKALLPEAVGPLKRTSIEAEKTAAGNFKISKAQAEYSDPADSGRNVRISVTDVGSNKMLAAMFGLGFIEQDKETESGYEKMGKVDGRPTHEKFNKDGPSGEYSLLVGGRFLVETHGNKVDMATIKQVATVVGFDKLEAMKNQGSK